MSHATGFMRPPDSQRQQVNTVREVVTKEKKKLNSAVFFNPQPPAGYTFIAAGDPDLTKELKEVARRDGKKIYSVTTTPHRHDHELSQEVHRIGFHFPSEVVQEVCDTLGIHITKQGTLADSRYTETFGRRHNKKGKPENDVDQTTINTMARDTIQDLFPNIPEGDLYTIIKTAFKKGRNKVGTANELSQVRRAQLSVAAHIRHIYTDYDKLLRTVGYHEARGRVERPTLKKLVEWRGDDESGKTALEQVMEDVVVLSDDDDEILHDIGIPALAGRSAEVPIITTHVIDPQDLDNSGLEDDHDRYRSYLPQPATRRRLIDDHFADEAQYRQRQAKWEKAREEYRENPVSLKPIIILDDSPRSTDMRRPLEFHDYTIHHSGERRPNHVVHDRGHRDSQTSLPRGRGSSTLVRGEDGFLYERIVHPQDGAMRPPAAPLTASQMALPLHHSEQLNHPTLHDPRPQRLRGESPRLHDVDDNLVPSIEGPQLSPWSLQRSERQHRPLSTSSIDRIPSSLYHRQRDIIDLTEIPVHSTARKRKIDDLSTNGMIDPPRVTYAPAPNSMRFSGQYESAPVRPLRESVRVMEGPLSDRVPPYRPMSPARDNQLASSSARAVVDGGSDYHPPPNHRVPSHFFAASRRPLTSRDDAQVHYRVPSGRLLGDVSHSSTINALSAESNQQHARRLIERPVDAPSYYAREPLREREIIELRSDIDALHPAPCQVHDQRAALDCFPPENYMESPRRYPFNEQRGPITAARAQLEETLYDQDDTRSGGGDLGRDYRGVLPVADRRYEHMARD